MARENEKKIEAFCVKCRKKVEVKDPELVETKNRRKVVRGKCPYCGTTVNKFVPKDFTL